MAKVLRKEMKYLLPIKKALRLEKYFRGFLELDNHGDHGGYLSDRSIMIPYITEI